MQLSDTITIKTSVKNAWGYLTNYDNLGDWIDGFEEYVETSERSGQHELIIAGRRILVDQEVLVFEMHKQLTLSLHADMIDMKVAISFTEVATEETELHVSIATQRITGLAQLAIGMKSPLQHKEIFAEQLQELKSILES